VDLTVHVEEGPQFLFGKLIVEGLDIHGEAAIRKLWAMKEGKPFDADYPDYFLKRVQEDNIFENLTKTRASMKVDEETRLVDVTLSFR
jgi:outer membrane translocation and assembly module TamA